VESGDVDGYVRRITTLDGQREALSQLSTRAREHVARTFGWDAVASHYIDHLSEPHSS